MPENNNHRHSNTPGAPYRILGRQIKTMRQRLQESLGETAGAVEIDVEHLDRVERGAELPSEDILMLLISHFGLDDDDAVRIWELAGYDAQARHIRGDDEDESQHVHQAAPFAGRGNQPPIMVLALDQRVLYTNSADINADEAGIVINFSQNEPNGPAQYVVGRMGMSYQQAEQLMHGIQRMLLHKQYLSGPKQLPSQTDNS